jgi:5-(carboxyamino)imidazole ribonucleotide synthase
MNAQSQPSDIPSLKPGATLGVFGGGQLGKMFCEAATRLGFKTHVFCPEDSAPAFGVSSAHTCAAYDDAAALKAFGKQIQAATFEFENIPVGVLQHLPKTVAVRPGERVLHVCQHRGREKQFLSSNGFPIAPYVALSTEADLALLDGFAFPGVIKTAGFGYDGKGQARVTSRADVIQAWEKFQRQPVVVEGFIDFQCEVSVIVARDIFGKEATWGVFENRHKNHILDVTLWPSSLEQSTQRQAETIALKIARTLGVVGLLAVEFFVTREGQVLVNEMAPRPHNSGHITMDASITSQFEQHVRAITGIGLSGTGCKEPGAMANLLGDLWQNGEPQWDVVAPVPNAFLHLYGKSEARKGRKMGHLNVLGRSAVSAAEAATALRAKLASR